MNTYHVGFWNLENLFAPEGFAAREPWIASSMARDLNGWTDALFQRKIGQLAKGITHIGSASGSQAGGPDILGVCEVENRFVLEQLVNALQAVLPNRNYAIVHADSERDHRGIDTAFIFDANVFTVDPDNIFSHFVLRRTGTRDITQVTFTTTAGNELIALANHWPSRSGGAEKSAGFRATAAETLAYWHQRIREERGNSMPIIAMGDMNDDPWDASLRFNASATREAGDVSRSQSARFFNLAWNYPQKTVIDHRGDSRDIDGTLYYNNDGNLFDQILVNRSLLNGEQNLQVDIDSANIDAFPETVDHRVGRGSIRFGLPKGNAADNIDENGFSDHFPVSVTITETP